ncbi:hypothetical protein GX51_04744 [Blastomyces parvus]|uniref:GPI inositol-deacylase n=1 Tax=Blastomyces parvus TaxID=2060905 RepID=A0A2B7X0I4_9EURO|nr:hypothetical protein GX51_04744 [Blastomyces parvus]
MDCARRQDAIGPRHSPSEDRGTFEPVVSVDCSLQLNDRLGVAPRKGSSKNFQGPDPLGLTLVYESDKPLADLIFVHGLGGSSLRTWSYNHDVENFWLPWLRTEPGMCDARVFTFGYNAHFAREATTLSILDFAKDLLFQAKTYHTKDTDDNKPIGQNPLIFVVHSMGGLVVKKAYIIGKTDPRYSDMISQTHGIVFLGTPHRGSSFAPILNKILRMVPTIRSKVYVNELEKSSTSINDINEQFRNVCGDLELVSFYETLRTTGVNSIIVEKESAVLGYPLEMSAPLHADHHGLSKFQNPEDGNYRDVVNVIRMFAQSIKELRTPLEPDKLRNPIPQVAIGSLLGITKLDDDLEGFRQRIQPGSCRWILEKQKFRDWIEEGELGLNVLWLSGSPGTGKSILSSFIIEYYSQDRSRTSCQYHFFQEGKHDSRTLSYFLRSIAFQIAEAHDEFRHRLLEMHSQSGTMFASQKYNIIWEKLFEGLLFRLNFGQALIWVLDGIDEAESPAAVVTLVSQIESVVPIKVLLVSRETKDLLIAMNHAGCRIRHEDIQTSDTMEDIKLFVSSSLQRTLPDNEKRELVIENVLSKASGSFLWAKLVVESLADNWHTERDIERALTEIPDGMEQMYERMALIVANQPPNVREMAIKILTWAACSFRPLVVEELAVALKPEFGSFNNLKITIDQICGDFIITKESKISLVHQTARQFLLSNNPRLPFSIDSRKGHELIARVCMNFLSDHKWKTRFTASQDPHSEVPFLLYATTFWAHHVRWASAESEELQNATFEFLEQFLLIWINAAALTGNLQLITRSVQDLKSYAKRIANSRSGISPTWLKFGRHQEMALWANDLIRLISRFGSHLAESPFCIYKYIIPFCPSETMLSRAYRHSNFTPMTVIGIPHGTWDNCLARLTMGGDETISKVVCKENYFIVLLGNTGTLVIWNAETCTETRRLYHDEWVTNITLARIRNLVVSAGALTIRVWDIGTGQEMYRIPKTNKGRLMSLTFASNDAQLLIAYDDCTVKCFDLATLQEQWCLDVNTALDREYQCPRFMVFSPDASRVAVADSGSPVFIFCIGCPNKPPHRCIRREDICKKQNDVWIPPEMAIWQPDSSNLFILYQDTVLVDWNIDDDSQTQHSHLRAKIMTVSRDGNLLLTSDYNGTLSIWSTGKFRLICQMRYDDEIVRDLAFAPGLQRFYDVRSTMCNVWEFDTLILPEELDREDMSSSDTLYSQSAVASGDRSRAQITTLVCGNKVPYYCIGRDDGTIAIYEGQTAKKLRKLYEHSKTVSIVEIAWSLSQKYIASADDSGRVMAKRLGKPTPQAPRKWAVYPLFDIRLRTTVIQLLFSESEEFLLISTTTADQIWSTKSKEKLFQVERSDWSHSRRWLHHPKDSRFLICIEGAEQLLYSWNNLKRIMHPEPQSGYLSSTNEVDERLGHSLADVILGDSSADGNTMHSFPPILPEAPEHAFSIGDHHIVLEYIAKHELRDHNGLHPTASRQLELIDLNEVPLRRIVFSRLSGHIHQLVCVFQGRLVFLNHQFWLCTWEFDSDEDSYRKHFFLPKDWLSPSSLKLVTMDHFGNLLYPKNGEVAIVQFGIRL